MAETDSKGNSPLETLQNALTEWSSCSFPKKLPERPYENFLHLSASYGILDRKKGVIDTIMMISTRGRYALRVMLDLAQQEPDQYIPLKDIATRQGISEKYLESIIRALSQNGDLRGIRGKGGGYQLTRSPEEYSIGHILRLTEGSLAPVSCLEDGMGGCERSDCCLTLPVWKKLDTMIQDYLDSVSLADLLNQQD